MPPRVLDAHVMKSKSLASHAAALALLFVASAQSVARRVPRASGRSMPKCTVVTHVLPYTVGRGDPVQLPKTPSPPAGTGWSSDRVPASAHSKGGTRFLFGFRGFQVH